MNVNLYNVSDPPNKISKKLNDKLVIENVRFKNEGTLDVLNPIIIIQLSDEISDYIKYNYVEIPKFTRFYWITSITTSGGLVEISCKADPIMSFKNDIIGSLQYVSRSENVNNRYLVDNLLPISSKHLFTIQPFGDPVYDEHCTYLLLETAGKGGV